MIVMIKMPWFWLLKGLFSYIVLTEATEQAIDLEKCGNCTNRDDVPCRIQEIPYPCPHSEFGNQWPGPPRSLTVQQVLSGDENYPWKANFTWKPPYDASISSMTGFLLTVNTVMTDYGVVELPKCFFANLMGTDLSTVKDPHSVVFHFDCMRVHMRTHVHMLLNSSPMPPEEAEGAMASIVLDLGTAVPVPPKINITFKTWGGKVNVDFGPVVADTFYVVCLSPLQSKHSSCAKTTNTTKSPVFFDDVKKDNYTIMIKPSMGMEFYASKYFLVKGEESTQPAKGYIDVSILIIILIGIIFVTLATSLAFCTMRKQGRCVPMCIKRCKERSIYEKTQTNIPNNEGADVCPICLDGESALFLDAVASVMSFLKKYGQCQIKEYWPVVCREEKDIATMVETYGKKMLIVFHSEDMVKFLKFYENKNDFEGLTAHKKFVLQLLRHSKVKESSEIHVGFHNHNWAPLKDIKVLNMTKLVEGKTELDVDINTDDVHQLLTKVSCSNLELTGSWSQGLEDTQVLTKTKAYLTSSGKSKSSYSSTVPESDTGYEHHVPTENISHLENPDHPPSYRESHPHDLRPLVNERDNFDRQARLHDTKQWAESQKQVRRGYDPQYQYYHAHMGGPAPPVDCYTSTGVSISEGYVSFSHDNCVMENNNIPKCIQRGTTCNRTGVERKELHPLDRDLPEGINFEWDPPLDDDTASITFSVIGEKQREMNEHYMQTLTSSARVYTGVNRE